MRGLERAALLRSVWVWCNTARNEAQILQGEVENSRTWAVDAMSVRREGGDGRYPVKRESGRGDFLRKSWSGTCCWCVIDVVCWCGGFGAFIGALRFSEVHNGLLGDGNQITRGDQCLCVYGSRWQHHVLKGSAELLGL